MPKLEIHPVVELFPPMKEDQFQELKEDIRKNGQLENIVVWKGLLVDGRHRLRACEELGIEPEIAELMEETDPIAWALSHNLHRRHLTTSQRSNIAAKLATMEKGRPETNAEKDAFTQQEAADLLGVSRESVQKAKAVIKGGCESLNDAVSDGTIKVGLAEKLVKLQPDKKAQDKLVKAGEKAVRQFVADNTVKIPRTTKAAEPAASKAAPEPPAQPAKASGKAEAMQLAKTVVNSTHKLLVIDSILKLLSHEDLTTVYLRCGELLPKDTRP